MDKQSDIVQHVEQYDAGIQIDNGDAHAIYNYQHSLSKELHEMGERAHQLFKDKYTREINTMKYYNLLK